MNNRIATAAALIRAFSLWGPDLDEAAQVVTKLLQLTPAELDQAMAQQDTLLDLERQLWRVACQEFGHCLDVTPIVLNEMGGLR